MDKTKIEEDAKALRQMIRRKAGLAMDWHTASESMKEWYRQRAILLEKSNG